MFSNPQNIRTPARFIGRTTGLLLLVITVIAVIETSRRIGIPLPAPFLLLFGGVALAAGLGGLWSGIAAATLGTAFIVYSWYGEFGPATLTGSVVGVLAGSAIAYTVAIVTGRARDRRVRITKELGLAQEELLQARSDLAARVERRTTELGQVSQELEIVRSRLTTAIEQSPAGVADIGTDGAIRSANPAMLQMLRLDRLPAGKADIREFLGDYQLFSSSGERISFGIGPLSDALERGEITDNFEFRLVRADETFSWFRASLGPIMADDRSIVGATVIMLDITEAKLAAVATRELSRQLMQVQEDERANLAHELHDVLGQHLTVLNLNLYALQKNPADSGLLEECISLVDDLSRTTRSLSGELRPAMLDELGLVAALRWYLRRQRERTGHSIEFDAGISSGKPPKAVTTACFRVVQEAVSNAIKHAECEQIAVRIYEEGGSLCVTVTDDGCGFDMRNRKSSRPPSFALGLISMRERTVQLGGTFAIDSEIGRGTHVSACVPLS